MERSYSARTFFIGGSVVIALVLMATAYASSGPLPFHTNVVGAESTHDILVSYASKDSDSDGLPDWQEALYGTDPNNAHSVSPNLSDSEAVAQGLVKAKFASATTTPADATTIPGKQAGPTTLTDQFSKELFGQYLKTRGGAQPSAADISTFVQQGIAQLKKTQVKQDTFNQGQVKVSGTGPDALLAYAASAELALAKTDVHSDKTELDYYSLAVNKNDTKALVEVKKYSVAYASAGQALMKIAVPKELALSHLKLTNALMRYSQSVSDMAELTNDPIRAMLGMATYSDNALLLAGALGEMNAVYVAEHVIPTPGTTGSSFYGATLAGVKK